MLKNIQTKAFTLVELMIVIVIFGILASLAAPAINDFFNSMATQTRANSIISGINKARATAITRNTSIIFFLTETGFWQYGCAKIITDDESGGYCPDDIIEQDSENTNIGDINITFVPTSNYILFNSLGISIKNETNEDPIENINIVSGETTYQIKVRNSGTAQLCEGSCL